MLFDTHAHLDADQLADGTDDLLAEAATHSVTRILTVATDLASSYRAIKLAEENESVFAAVGIHPNQCHETSPTHWKEITSLIDHPKVVALGETGLDDHWDFCPMDVQREYFLEHIKLSHSSGLPFIVTCVIANRS